MSGKTYWIPNRYTVNIPPMWSLQPSKQSFDLYSKVNAYGNAVINEGTIQQSATATTVIRLRDALLVGKEIR